MPVVVEEGNHAYYYAYIQILYLENKFVYWCLKENNDNSSHSMKFFFLFICWETHKVTCKLVLLIMAHTRIFGIGLELVCNWDSYGEYHQKEPQLQAMLLSMLLSMIVTRLLP